MMKPGAFRITIASPDYRERLVAEVFFGHEQWAEINQEGKELAVEFYPRRDGTPWTFEVDEAIAVLAEARDALANYNPRESPFFKDMSDEEWNRLFGDESD
jgi:hypothetical protein